MQYKFTLFLALVFLSACSVKPKGTYADFTLPKAPDYSSERNWAALPTRADMADKVPATSIKDRQQNAKVDVFYIHPTTYTGDKGHKGWHGSLEDAKLNKKTDETAILNHASIFNGTGKVYAPRYRQAHIQVYYDKYKAEGKAALDLAYSDVKAAFSYYLEHYNQGRPFIIVGHSQGTTHGGRLVKEMIEGTPLQEQMVVAYLVGMPIPADFFTKLKPCENAQQTNCFCGWRTYKEGHFPKKHVPNNNIIVTNPISWTTEEIPAPQADNMGAVLYDFDAGFFPNLVSARVKDGVLWTNKPKFKGSILLQTKNYHIADLNLFYLDVRTNAELRVKAYFGE